MCEPGAHVVKQFMGRFKSNIYFEKHVMDGLRMTCFNNCKSAAGKAQCDANTVTGKADLANHPYHYAYSSDAAKKAGEDAAKAVWDEWKTAEDAKAAAVAKAAADAKAKKDADAKAGADVAKTTSGSVENSLAFGAVVVAALAVV